MGVKITVKIKDDRKVWDRTLASITKKVPDIPNMAVGLLDAVNAPKAAFAEFGTARTAQRPFMSRALDENGKAYDKILGEMIGKVVDGKAAPQAPMQALGRRVVNDIQGSIKNGSFAPLKASTIENKDSDTPLIDTGAMHDAVAFKLGVTADGEG